MIPAALGSAVGGAFVNIYLRKLSDTENVLTTSIYYNGTGAMVFAVWVWVARLGTCLRQWIWRSYLLLGLVAGMQQFALGERFSLRRGELPDAVRIPDPRSLPQRRAILVWGEVPGQHDLARWESSLPVQDCSWCIDSERNRPP